MLHHLRRDGTDARVAALFGALIASGTSIGQTPFEFVDQAHNRSTERRETQLSTLEPVVRRFTFDGQAVGPNSLPPDFYRYVAPGAGFPPFGEMRVVEEKGVPDPARGRASGALVFDLAGGSMSARIGTSVVPVLPRADYIVTCRVRTLDLVHAHARLVTWLCDSSGQPIPASRAWSRLANTAGEWETLRVETSGSFPEAVDLVFELQVVQPDVASVFHVDQPRFQDVRGRACFDEVTVSHLPRIALQMSTPGRIVEIGAEVSLLAHIREAANDRLNGRLTIMNVDGHVIREAQLASQSGNDPAAVSLCSLPCGWYRGVLEITGRDGVARRCSLDFVVVNRPGSDRRNAFGVKLDELPSAATLPHAVAILDELDPLLLIAPVWSHDVRLEAMHDWFAERRGTLQSIARRTPRMAFDLEDVPLELASKIPEGASAPSLLASDARLWRPYLDDILMQFGLTVDQWLVGPADQASHQADVHDPWAGRARLAEFVPSPRLFVTIPVHGEPPRAAPERCVTIQLPATLAPHAILDHLQTWTSWIDDAIIEVQALPLQSRFSPRQRMADAALRALFAWRSGAHLITFDAPWQRESLSVPDLSPLPEFAAWRTLGRALAGRQFVRELDLAPGVHAWIVQGSQTDDAALIAWADLDSNVSAATTILAQLSDQAVTIVDMFGNAASLTPEDRLHRLSLRDLPVIVEGINAELVLFRGGVAIEPNYVPAAARAHEHELVLRNPWDETVSGVARLLSDGELELRPDVIDFSIPPGGETRLPLQVIPRRGIIDGRKPITANIALNSNHSHTMQVDLGLDVGLREIEVTTTWSRDDTGPSLSPDVVITVTVTSRVNHPLNLDIDLLAANVPHARRTIAALQPGQTQVRTFRLSGAWQAVRGRNVHVSVSERDGLVRLTRRMHIDDGSHAAVLSGASVPSH